MVGREPVAVGVLPQVGQPDGLRVDDEEPEDAVALGQVADRGPILLVDADGDELRQAGAGVVEHAQGAVAGIDELGGALHDPPQHRRQVEIGADRHHRVEELTQASGRRPRTPCDDTSAGTPGGRGATARRAHVPGGVAVHARMGAMTVRVLPARRSRDRPPRAAGPARGRGRSDGRRRGGHGRGGPPAHPRHPPRRGGARRAPARRRRRRGLPGDPLVTPRDQLPDADVVRRRRSPVRGDHGGRRRLRAQAGAGHRPRRRDAARGGRGESLLDPAVTARVLERLRQRSDGEDELSALTEQERKILDAHRRGPHEPPDRRADVPRREDGQELRVERARRSSA